MLVADEDRGSQLRRRLDALTATGAAVLHDRRLPKSRTTLDHVLVTATGIYVVDVVDEGGSVGQRYVSGLFRTGLRLYFDERDRTKLVGEASRKALAVRHVLGRGAASLDVPVTPVLCIVGAEWGLFPRPLRFDDVLVAWPNALARLAAEPGSIPAGQIERIAERLADRLPPAAEVLTRR
jgi:hypothetical protein